MFEVPGAVKPAHVTVQHLLVDGLTWLGVHDRLGSERIHPAQIVKADFIHGMQVGDDSNLLAPAQFGVFFFGYGELRQTIGQLAGRSFSGWRNLGQVIEVAG